MKYHKHLIRKIIDGDVIGGCYWFIQRVENRVTSKGNKYIVIVNVTHTWTLNNAKEFIDTYDGTTYNWNVLC